MDHIRALANLAYFYSLQAFENPIKIQHFASADRHNVIEDSAVTAFVAHESQKFKEKKGFYPLFTDINMAISDHDQNIRKEAKRRKDETGKRNGFMASTHKKEGKKDVRDDDGNRNIKLDIDN